MNVLCLNQLKFDISVQGKTIEYAAVAFTLKSRFHYNGDA